MAAIRCKMCGSDLLPVEGASTARCEYCGSLQTVPIVDQEKKRNLFTRASRLRFGCEFDKAFGVYETIVGQYPEEPEAYWGLVLCRYGIEYVDDPLTGKKIPTCHRFSFQSVPEDSNYELALEYADPEARKLYRQEAKIIEKLRKEIQEISAQEAPYDVFICYKETKPGTDERTLDSVLAQDLYDTLTHKGYRVFFSRVTLEDKVGQKYEPYIFAALNSARVMLVVGTDYEHFQAVWVKNEWRRYLMLMQEDRDKHLIPCYKNIDVEELPQEFRRLQAQNLGKVGAEQDLLRGIEKLLPKGSRSTAPRKKVDPALTALLERGKIALEDRQWEEADRCFEQVLQQNSEIAESYVGKLLVRERRKSLDALVEKWLEDYADVECATVTVPTEARYKPADFHPAAEEFLNREAMESLYAFAAEYASEVTAREEQYRMGQKFWEEEPMLICATRYADGSLVQQLQGARDHFIGELKSSIDRAVEQDRDASAKEDYERKLEEANEKAAKLYQEAEVALEEEYRRLCDKSQYEQNPQKLKSIAARLDSFGDYKQSANVARNIWAKARKAIEAQDTQESLRHQQQQEALMKKYLEKAENEEREEEKRATSIVMAIFYVIAGLLSLLLTMCEKMD